MENITIVAIDLAKSCFQVRGINRTGKALYNKSVRRESLMEQVLRFPQSAEIVMEACGTANYWGRRFESQGYKVVLIAPQHVKPYVGSQKNDDADAEAIGEAASRANRRVMPVKPIEQQDIQSMHRVRERYVTGKTALMNELRGLLLEYGIVIPKGRAALGKLVPESLESESLTEVMKVLTRSLYEELIELEARVKEITKRIELVATTNDKCKRIMTIPGIAKITATAIYALAGHMNFNNGREFAAFLGLVPRQHSTGGKGRLGAITKNGDKYVRKLLVHGGRSVLQNANRHDDRYNSWAKMIRDKKGYAKGAVAVANRNARAVWAIMSSDVSFEHNFDHKAWVHHNDVVH